MTGKKTFWDLLQQQLIEIPHYQRDYAQGRISSDVEYIRKNLLGKISEALKSNEKMDLNLIFGSESENKRFFVPVDGQQRLTTLWIFHWYIAIRAGKLEENRTIFAKFSYLTRQSSKEFIHFLCNFITPSNQCSVIDSIRNHSSFFTIWEKDPTVRGVMEMLRHIEKVFSSSDYSDIWRKIISRECPIEFTVVSVEENKLSPQLYLKMNARGKQLTDFENFKAWFSWNIIKNKYSVVVNNWEILLDTEWLDIFWKYKDKEDYLVDQEYMRFFNGMAQITTAAYSNLPDEKLGQYIQIFTTPKNLPDSEELRIPLLKYEELRCFNQDCINEAFNVLELLKCDNMESYKTILRDIDFFIGEKTVFERFINRKCSYVDRVRFFALYKYLLTFGKDFSMPDSVIRFCDWMRIMRNLIANTTIDAPLPFIHAIKSIAKILETMQSKNLSVIELLAGDSGVTISFFNKEQFDEERMKAIMVKKYPLWLGEFMRAEEHQLFRGSIRVIIGESLLSDTDITVFQHRFAVAQKVWNDKGEQDFFKEKRLLMRALISQIKEWTVLWNMSFENNTDNWRNIFKQPSLRTVLTEFLDKHDEHALLEFCKDLIHKPSQMPDKITSAPAVPKTVHENLFSGELLCFAPAESRLRWWGNHVFLHKNGAWYNWLLIDNARNQLLDALLRKYPDQFESSNQCILQDGKPIPYFRERDITCKLNGYVLLCSLDVIVVKSQEGNDMKKINIPMSTSTVNVDLSVKDICNAVGLTYP